MCSPASDAYPEEMGLARHEVHDRRIVEIGYALLPGAGVVLGVALIGHVLGWSSSPAHLAVLAGLGLLALVRAVVVLSRFETWVRQQQGAQQGACHDAGQDADGPNP